MLNPPHDVCDVIINKSIFYPAVVAWSVKALVFHSVNSSPEQAVDRIPSGMVY